MSKPENDPLELLKWRLLLRRLDAISDCGLHARIMQEANAALSLARRSGFPFLTFPSLFEERADQAAEAARCQAWRYWRGFAEVPPLGDSSALRNCNLIVASPPLTRPLSPA